MTDIADDIIGAMEAATRKWTRQKKSEERQPGNIRYRVTHLTKEPRTSQKDAAAAVLEGAYMAASNGGRLPASARQIYYQARPKIMALTDDRELKSTIFHKRCCPNISRRTASIGTLSTTRAGIARSPIQICPSDAERLQCATTSPR
jgi:hypothetical protein